MGEINDPVMPINESEKLPKAVLDIFGNLDNFKEAIKKKLLEYLGDDKKELLISEVGPLPILLGYSYVKLSKIELATIQRILGEMKREVLPPEMLSKKKQVNKNNLAPRNLKIKFTGSGALYFEEWEKKNDK